MASDLQHPPSHEANASDRSLPQADASTFPRFGNLGYTAYHAQVAANSLLINHRDGRSLVPTLSAAHVDIRPHQVECAIAALRSPLSRGMLLADETGLGKTVEAGIVIAQRWAEHRRAILLIVPATLRDQWQRELLNKFGLPCTGLDGSSIELTMSRQGTLLGAEPRILIMTYGVASNKAHILAATPWDLVVIDEAHRLRNVSTASPESQSRRIREALRGRTKLLLTATPLQNTLVEFHGMLSFIEDETFCDHKDFTLLYARNPKPAQLADLAEMVRPVIRRHLRSAVQASGHVAFTERIATTVSFEPYADELELYEFVSSYLMREDTVAFGAPPNPLILSIARKLLASSPAAILGFLRTVLRRLRHAEAMDLAALDDREDVDAAVQDAEDLVDAHAAAGVLVSPAEFRNNSQDAAPLSSLDDEIAEVQAYIAVGEAIRASAKGDRLAAELPGMLDKVCGLGGRRKAVIFTESRKTQAYLVELLHHERIKEQIITLNGSNDDMESAKLLHEWRVRHADDGSASGLRSSDLKAAIIESFLEAEAAVLISTESGGEGVNLQDCSVVINYDLPWNPQRLEQRIGRCHRYGQKIDVLVFNLQNKHNKVEERLIDLLTRKFKIFEGLFGASNDVLGAIQANVDFSAEILRITQTCRSDVAIEHAFAALEQRLEAAIASDLADARRKLFDVVDEDVIQRLHARARETAALVDDFTRRLAIIIRSELPDARLDDAVPLTIAHDDAIWTTQWSHAQLTGARHLKLAEGSWASSMVDRAATRSLPLAAVHFDIAAMRSAGFPRLSDVERFAGRAGWLRVSRLSFHTAAEATPRAVLVFSGLADDGTVLDCETALRLFLVPGEVVEFSGDPTPAARLVEIERVEQARLTELAKAEGAAWRAVETDKLDRQVRDVRRAAELRAKELFDRATWMRMRLRGNSELSPEEKLGEQREIRRVEKEGEDIIMGALPRLGELRERLDRNFDEIENSLKLKGKINLLFTIQWSIYM